MILQNDIAAFSTFRVVKYQYIRVLNISREFLDGGYSKYKVELVLSNLDDGQVVDLQATFSGVSDIVIGDMAGMACVLMEIEDISDHQLEGVSYQVSDSENRAFSFKCAEFRIECPD